MRQIDTKESSQQLAEAKDRQPEVDKLTAYLSNQHRVNRFTLRTKRAIRGY